MENLKMATKCANCEKSCKQYILNGDVKYCPKYVKYNCNKSRNIYKRNKIASST